VFSPRCHAHVLALYAPRANLAAALLDAPF
jgi:hypothetical protein